MGQRGGEGGGGENEGRGGSIWWKTGVLGVTGLMVVGGGGQERNTCECPAASWNSA